MTNSETGIEPTTLTTRAAFEAFQFECMMLDQVAKTSSEFRHKERAAASHLEERAAAASRPSQMVKTFRDAYRALGAPGDFGYGTAEGDAMNRVYQTWNTAVAAEKAETPDVAESLDRSYFGADV